jgi:DNA-binding XRE family transcriptional regulator
LFTNLGVGFHTPFVDIVKVVSRNLRKFREIRGWSVIDLAKKCKVAKQTIYQIEDGTNWIGLKTVQKVCRELGIDQHELFQFDKRSTNN